MTLRLLVLLLFLANLGFFAWSQGHLDDLVSIRSLGDREPERLARQVRSESLRVLPPQAASTALSAFTTAGTSRKLVSVAEPASVLNTTVCMEAGPFSTAEVQAAEQALQDSVPTDSWTRRNIKSPDRWMIYMGKYPNLQTLQKKAGELSEFNVAFTEVAAPPELKPGISLGDFETRAAAQAALAKLAKRGVRTAVVISVTQPTTTYTLRVENADKALAEQLSALEAEALGKGFAACTQASDAL